MENIEKLNFNGYWHVPEVFTKSEIKDFRKNINLYLKNNGVELNAGVTQPNAAVSVPEINGFYYHTKVLGALKEAFGTDDIVFTSHCDIHCKTLSGWHKDDGITVMEGSYFDEPAYDFDNCKVYKVALYLQDHDRNRGGLTVKKGSHRVAGNDGGEEVYIPTKAGDIVIFDVRLTHVGQREEIPIPSLKSSVEFVRKVLVKFKLTDREGASKLLRRIYDFWSGDRISIFYTYGLDNHFTHVFARNNMKRQIEQTGNKEINLSDELKIKLNEAGVKLAEDHFADLV